MAPTISVWLMVGLDLLMIVYTLWVLSLNRKNKINYAIGLALLVWLTLLHFGLSTKSIFPENIAGTTFLMLVFIAVGLVGLLLFVIPPMKKMMLALNQEQLLLAQGIRVFFGASFLMQAGLGNMPLWFGIIDGWTHIGAGFFGLIVAYAVAKDADASKRLWFANIFGLVDILIVASTLSLFILADITPHGSMMYAVFLPAPIWLWFHVLSIWKLLNDTGNSQGNKNNIKGEYDE